MSVVLMRAARPIVLPSSQKFILILLADSANGEGRCWPAVTTLARESGLSIRTVQTSLQALEDAGHVTRIERSGRSSLYSVHPRNDCGGGGAMVAGVGDENPAGEGRKSRGGGVQLLHPAPATAAGEPIGTTIEPSIQPSAREDFDRVIEAARLRLSGAKLDAQRGILADWDRQGFDLERDILPGIVRAIGERPDEPTNSLKRFSTTIAKLHLERSAGGPRSSAPEPIFEFDGEDRRFIAVRQKLAKAIGPLRYCTLTHDIRFETAQGRGGEVVSAKGTDFRVHQFKETISVSSMQRICQSEGFADFW